MNKKQFKLGVKPDGTIRDTLSWSGYNMWRTSKDSYRKRYYENQKPFETVETIFGKKIAEQLEADENIPGSETEIKVTLKCGLKLISYLDEFNEKFLSITEHKTGHRNKDGKVPWDNVKVAKHKQLDFYSMMVQKAYGNVNNVVTLKWHETAFKKSSVEFDGHVLTADSRDLELTGYTQEFTRVIRQWERNKLEKDLIQTAKEITKDYEEYIKNK